MALIDTEKKARSLARAIASDLALYNEDKTADGIRNDTLFDEMAAEIQEGRDLYQSRVAPDLMSLNLYDRAIIDLLVRSKAHIESPMW